MGFLWIVIGDPTDIDTIGRLKFRLNVKLETCLGAKSKIKHHINRIFADEQSSIDKAGAETRPPLTPQWTAASRWTSRGWGY